MYVGRIVEIAPTEALFSRPRHPYTEALLSAVPRPDPAAKDETIILKGEIANAAAPPSGCAFHPRCRYAQAICATTTPPLAEIAPGHVAACHFARDLSLAGATRGLRLP